jgi:histidinol-phosphatase (PHP family)
MLTDYHVHLRVDDIDSTPASAFFTPANAERYRAVAEERGIAELGVSEHVHRFRQSLDVWEHPWWRKNAVDDLDAYCAFVREETDLRLGIEADFVAGREDRMASLIEAREWDYVIGSVHFIRDDAVDMEEFDIWRSGDADKVWARYFDTLGEAARTGMYDIIAHPDLVKVWGPDRPRPDGDLRRFYERAIEGMVDGDVAVEVSTAGLRKRAREIYPAPAFLELCLEAGLPVALSSDAHVPADVGRDYERALEVLAGLGVRELCVFAGRERRLEPIGAAG